MKKLSLLLAVTVTLFLSGCAGLVDFATDALKEMQDTNRYETIRGSVESLCDTKNYDMFIDRFGKDTVDKWMVDVCSPVTRKTDPGIN